MCDDVVGELVGEDVGVSVRSPGIVITTTGTPSSRTNTATSTDTSTTTTEGRLARSIGDQGHPSGQAVVVVRNPVQRAGCRRVIPSRAVVVAG